MSQEPISVVFFGTPEFALPSLEALATSPLFQVLAVVTQVDRPAGRGQKLTPPPVKERASALSIPVFQPKSLSSLRLEHHGEKKQLYAEKSCRALAEFLTAHDPLSVFVCVAYGKLVPSALLSFADHGMVNVHPSLLPRWRGAAPLQRTLLAGDSETGVCLMDLDEGLDSGPVYARVTTPIASKETLGSLHDRLAKSGAELLIQTLPQIVRGGLAAIPQATEGITYAEKWAREESNIDWEQDASLIVRRVRACNPVPGARSSVENRLIKIFDAEEMPGKNLPAAAAGTIVECNAAELIVACGHSQYIAVKEIQFSGKSRLPIQEALRGRFFSTGQRFTPPTL